MPKGEDAARELVYGYVERDRKLYNSIYSSANTIPVPEKLPSAAATATDMRAYTEQGEKSLNQILMESLERPKSPEHKQSQRETASTLTNFQRMTENNRSK